MSMSQSVPCGVMHSCSVAHHWNEDLLRMHCVFDEGALVVSIDQVDQDGGTKSLEKFTLLPPQVEILKYLFRYAEVG